MTRKKKVKETMDQKKKIMPIAPVRRLFIVFGILNIITILFCGILLSFQTMKQNTEAAFQSASAQVSKKIEESIKLLTSLASLPEYNDPSIPWEEKVEKLDKINEGYDYMMICYVDSDIQVYTIGEEPASLASREYMQKLFATQKNVVTDSFVAGADGKTLNYTVAVPLKKNGVITGSLFCAIKFDDTVKFMEEAVAANKAEAVLIGSKGQIMSSTNGMSYGADFTSVYEGTRIFGVTTDQLEANMLSRKTGYYQSFKSGNIIYTKYGPVENTNWDVIVSVDFLSLLIPMLPYLITLSILSAMLTMMLYYFVRKHIMMQAYSMQRILTTIHKMEKEMQRSMPSYDVDYENIMQITGKGLKDDLTGAATRVFFLNQAEQLLEGCNKTSTLALCFVDLDDLKILNDTYGHLAGDAALKAIGKILREYERKYDGIVGRYGGDEFVLIMSDVDDLDELKEILSEMVERLTFTLQFNEENIAIHSSIGASIRRNHEPLELLIANADKALYDVKRHGKASYSVFLDGEVKEL